MKDNWSKLSELIAKNRSLIDATGVAPVRIMACDGLTVETKLRRLNKYIAQTARVWTGTQAEYDAWALETFRKALQGIGNYAVTTRLRKR